MMSEVFLLALCGIDQFPESRSIVFSEELPGDFSAEVPVPGIFAVKVEIDGSFCCGKPVL